MYNSKLPKQPTFLESMVGSAKQGTGAFILFEVLDAVADKVQGLIALFAKIVWRIIRGYIMPRFSAKATPQKSANDVRLLSEQSTYRTSAGFNLSLALEAENIKKQRALQKS